MLKLSVPMDRSRKISLVKKKRLWKRLPDEEVVAFWRKVVEDADEVRECAEMKKKRPHKKEIWTQDLYSHKLALNQVSYTKNLRENPTRTYKENEPYGSKLALAGN